ncbi:MAG: hypothetical protein LH478_03645 [Chitinophagaceae bacterium]|nr:hypothetical protein [Chitinophagaceae bacterium]
MTQSKEVLILPAFMYHHLDELLADEYVLMNKTVNLLLCLPIVPEKEVPEMVYDQLKKNVKDITTFIKANALSINLSINNFLEKTRLSSTPTLNGCYAWFQHIIADHQFIISRIDEVLSFLQNEDEVYHFFKQIRERHTAISGFLNHYKQDFSKLSLLSNIAG